MSQDMVTDPVFLSVLHRQHGKLCHSGGLIQDQAAHAGRQ
ncbi:rCG36787 [Rattus norvegicus]|uniref:RCG36787 n=1 Tax=Rattus norvegicus TaxID=10116 RepID=A6JS04_RAT|nr:rCG36787 [Rattus norvegicus]